jgi:hypothetical protein
LNLGGDEVNDLFNFGDFEDVLHQAAEAPRQFSIGFAFQRPKDPERRVNSGQLNCIYGQASKGNVVIQDLDLQTAGRRFGAVRRNKGAFSILVDGETQPGLSGRTYAPERSIAFSADAIAGLNQDGRTVEDLSLAIRREFESIIYLGPLRRRPERDYSWNKTTPGDVGIDGRGAVDALLASALIKGPEYRYILDGVSHWLNRMKVADKLDVRQQGRSNRYELVVYRDGVASNIRDVGIGISQVLPVLVIAHFAPPGSTVILEEPEIHLHPLAQSILAELFGTISRERKVQFIVETHSEHLFRRMQTLVARQEATPSTVAMYFIERDGQAAKLRQLELDDLGRVRNWPASFFGDALGETREQTALAIKRAKELRATDGKISN